MTFRSILSISFLSAIFFVSCDKDDNDNQSQAVTDITTSKWQISDVSAANTPVNNLVPSCYLDNQLTFSSDNTGTVEENTDVCDPTTAGDFTWSFNASHSEITMSTRLLPGGTNVFKVVTLNSTTMVLSQVTNLIPAPIPIEVVVTFTHP